MCRLNNWFLYTSKCDGLSNHTKSFLRWLHSWWPCNYIDIRIRLHICVSLSWCDSGIWQEKVQGTWHGNGVCCGGKVFGPSSVCQQQLLGGLAMVTWKLHIGLRNTKYIYIFFKLVTFLFFLKKFLKLFPKHVRLCHVNKWHKSINFLFSHKRLTDALMRLSCVHSS